MSRTETVIRAAWLLVAAACASSANAQNARTPVQILAEWDVDRDGRLSEAEFVVRAKTERKIAERDFRLFDLDADGFLGVGEFAVQPTVFPVDRRGPLPDPLADYVASYLGLFDQQFPNWVDGGEAAPKIVPFARFLETLTGSKIGPDTPTAVYVSEHFDANGSGRIERDEGLRAIEMMLGVRSTDGEMLRLPNGCVYNMMHFGHCDTDRNGELDAGEFTAIKFGGRKNEDVFATGDLDRNGTISAQEWRQVPGSGRIDVVIEFRRLDTNLDGRADREELVAGAPDWKKRIAVHGLPAFDLDGDGLLSLAEYRLSPLGNPIVKWHDHPLDRDGDERLSLADFTWNDGDYPLLRREYFQRLDVNHDGALGLDEYIFKTTRAPTYYVLGEDGTGWRKLFHPEGYQAGGSPEVSPDGRTIAFDAWKLGENKQQLTPPTIFAIDADGSNLRELCTGMMPSWSPDGEYFACSRNETYGVWIMTAKGEEHKYVRRAWGAQWSPDGKKIGFYEGTSIMVYDVESEAVTEVLGGEANPYREIYWNMTWSPDSERICFKGTNAEGVNEIGIVNAAGAELGFQRRHAVQGIYADFAWHPGGRRIVCAFPCPERGRTQLYEFEPDTDDPPKLFPGQDPHFNNVGMCWTPDGKHLIVVSKGN